MNKYDEELAALRAEQQAILDRDMALIEAAADPLRHDRTLFLMLLIRTRQAKGLSQAKLAAKLGMQQSAIARIESGRGNPGLQTLLTIAKALDVRLVLE